MKLATAAETRTGTSTTRTVTPSALTAGLDNRASDDAPEAPASTAAAGSSTDFSRSDHRHVEGTGSGTGPALSDDTPEAIDLVGEAGTSDEASRADHVHPDHLFQGAWSSGNAPYDAAQIVIQNSVYWLSLGNNNSEAPSPASRLWIGLPPGLRYRGPAPVATTKYHYGHFVSVPPSNAHYVCTFTAGGQGIDVARADIPTHVNFTAITLLLSPTTSPVNIGPQSQQGTGDEASRDDHTHYLPHDGTLDFNEGVLGVNIADVVEHLVERVQYYTDGANYSTDGSAAGQVYNTSRYPKNLQWVKAHLRVPTGVSDAIYRAGAYIVDETRNITAILGQSAPTGIITGTGTYRFDFLATDTSALGIPLEGNERIEVLIRRVGAGNTAETGLIHGSENADSPRGSYVDAEDDFILVNHVIVEHENPQVGQGTAGHGTDIRGNLQLGYTVTIDHGSLVGDPGNINVSHISSGAATDGQVATADGAGGTAWEDAAAGGTVAALTLKRCSITIRSL